MSKIIITKSYSRNINLGNYESARVETTLSKEVEVGSPKELEKYSNQLLELCKKFTHADLLKIKNKKEEEYVK